MLSYLSRATLDIIGLAGFNYEFNALHPISKDGKREENELSGAFARLFRAAGSHKVLGFLQAWFPVFRMIVSCSLLICRRVLTRLHHSQRARAARSQTHRP